MDRSLPIIEIHVLFVARRHFAALAALGLVTYKRRREKRARGLQLYRASEWELAVHAFD